MPKIRVLDQYTINQIAAGEVVERPQAVVKELVENAIDAKASAITVEIKAGGIDFIRVTDNGSGIDKEDIPYVFLRHSTSKISKVVDLINISSLGFRGEALSSISAVAQVELITKTDNSLTGIRYQIAGEVVKEPEEIGCPNGTTIIIRNLFFNTPARKKFLKTPNTEAGYINELMNRLAASHPNVSFKFINNNKIKLQTSGNGNLKDIIYNIYGREIAFNLIPVKVETQSISLEGFIGDPRVSRANRTYENYFLNGRFIKSSVITKAIEEAYKPYTMHNKFPFTSLNLEIDPSLVDVNVHPTKLEVRFKDGGQVYDFVYDCINKALQQKEHIPQVSLHKERKHNPEYEKSPEPFERKRRAEDVNFAGHNYGQNIVRDQASYQKLKDVSPEHIEKIKEKISDTEIGKLREVIEEPLNILNKEKDVKIQEEKLKEEIEQLAFLSEEAMKDHRLIGQVFSTYWIIEYSDNLYIIDQHAAHEKVLFEKIMEDLNNKIIVSQNLNPPIVLTLSMREQEIIEEYLNDFKQLGFEIEEFGGNEYAVRAIPSDLDALAQKEILIELIDNLTEEVYNSKPEVLTNKIAMTACKSAIKANQKLSAMEVNLLIESLLKLENPYFCPHGRPTMIAMSKYELEKKFKRV